MTCRSLSTSRRRIEPRRLLGLSVATLLGLAAWRTAHAAEVSEPVIIPVMVDNAKVIRLPEKTQTVIVGNPIIADVSLQKNGVVVLTGKSFGTTNLIALDVSGAMLAESLIRVQAPQTSTITVQRGLDRESYSCTPHCQPSAQLGDSTKYFSEVSTQADQRRALAIAGSGGR